MINGQAAGQVQGCGEIQRLVGPVVGQSSDQGRKYARKCPLAQFVGTAPAPGFTAAGSDPRYLRGNHVSHADAANLGFGISVTMAFDDRGDALTGAFCLARRFLIVSFMPASQKNLRGQLFYDALLTKRRTFQT